MAIAKVILNGETLMDVTSDTVEASSLLNEVTATKNDGTKVTGTYVPPSPVISSLTVTPTETAQTFNAAAVSGYKPVTINAISSNYVGSAIPLKSAADLTTSESTVTVPAGYYSSAADKNVTSGSVRIGDITISPNINRNFASSTGVFTVNFSSIYYNSASFTKNVTDGYITSDNVSLPTFIVNSRSFSETLPTLSATTYTPSTTAQYISSYQWLTGSQTIAAIPSSYVIPSGTYSISSNGTYDIGSYASVDVSVAGGEGGGYENEIITRTISAYENSTVSIVGAYAFMKCDNLSEVTFPNVTEIHIAAFSACSSLETITFPNAQILESYCFAECSSISTASFPNVLSIGNNAFVRCYRIGTASFPNVLSIGNNAFAQCSYLTSVYAPLVETVGTYAFSGCTRLSIININNAVRIGSYAFQSCKSLQTLSCSRLEVLDANAFSVATSFHQLIAPNLTSIGTTALGYTQISSISFPKLTTIGVAAFINTPLTSVSLPLLMSIPQSAFRYCASLSTASFNAVSYISSTAFVNCFRLTSLYILSTSVVELGNINVFSSTPIAGYTNSTSGVLGSIYVPASLYDSYVLATNWSNYSSRIVSV